MANDTRNIVITIKGASSKKKKNENEEFASNLSKLLHPIKTLENSTIGQIALLQYAYNNAKQLVSQSVQGVKTRYLALTEDYIAENSMAIISSVSNKAMTVIGNITNGAILGAKFGGPVGALAGAGLGLSTAGAQLVIDRINTTSSFYRSLNETNYNTQFSSTRASLVNNGRGTEN